MPVHFSCPTGVATRSKLFQVLILRAHLLDSMGSNALCSTTSDQSSSTLKAKLREDLLDCGITGVLKVY